MELNQITTLEELQTYLIENDQIKLIDKDGPGEMVNLLFEDGEHVCTKGGELFLKRSMHQFGKAVIFEKDHMIKLPNSIGTSTYVVIGNAAACRKKMEEIYREKYPLPTEISDVDIEIVRTYCQKVMQYMNTLKEQVKKKKDSIYEIKSRTEQQEETILLLNLIWHLSYNYSRDINLFLNITPVSINQITTYAGLLEGDFLYFTNSFLYSEKFDETKHNTLQSELKAAQSNLLTLANKYDHLI